MNAPRPHVIDVNTGKNVGDESRRDVFRNNLEARRSGETAAPSRHRGIIVIDFIDMENRQP